MEYVFGIYISDKDIYNGTVYNGISSTCLVWKTLWEFPKKLNITLPDSLIIPSSTLGSTERSINICPHKELYVNIHSNIIRNSLKLEIIPMPMNSKM